MLRAEMKLQQEINSLMCVAEILDAQDKQCYSKGNHSGEAPNELLYKQKRLKKYGRIVRKWRRKLLQPQR